MQQASRRHSVDPFFLTQFLSGHGSFRNYLYKRGKVSSLKCGYCRTETDDANHTFLECERWAELNHRLESDIQDITPDNIVGVMLQSEEW